MMKAAISFVLVITLVTVASSTIVRQNLGPYNVTFNLTNTSLELNASDSKWDDPLSDVNGGAKSAQS
jgi:hypothetical protein